MRRSRNCSSWETSRLPPIRTSTAVAPKNRPVRIEEKFGGLPGVLQPHRRGERIRREDGVARPVQRVRPGLVDLDVDLRVLEAAEFLRRGRRGDQQAVAQLPAGIRPAGHRAGGRREGPPHRSGRGALLGPVRADVADEQLVAGPRRGPVDAPCALGGGAGQHEGVALRAGVEDGDLTERVAGADGQRDRLVRRGHLVCGPGGGQRDGTGDTLLGGDPPCEVVRRRRRTLVHHDPDGGPGGILAGRFDVVALDAREEHLEGDGARDGHGYAVDEAGGGAAVDLEAGARPTARRPGRRTSSRRTVRAARGAAR